MLVAVGVPIVLCMFLAIRNRQLQSTSNPRWAQFAKVTGPTAGSTDQSAQSNRIEVRTASINSSLISLTPTAVSSNIPTTNESPIVPPKDPEDLPLIPPASDSINDANATAATSEIDVIMKQVDKMNRPESELHGDNTQLTVQLVGLLNDIRDSLSRLAQAQEAIQKSEASTVPSSSEPSKPAFDEVISEISTSVVKPTTIESVQDVELKQFLNRCGDLAQIEILTAVQPQPEVQTPSPESTAPQPTQLSRSLNEARFVLRLEEDVMLICTVEESNRLKPGQFSRIPRANWQRDSNSADLNQLLPLLFRGFVYPTDAQTARELTDSSYQGGVHLSISRRALARLLFESAMISRQNGEHAKSRQQIEASLRQNNNDLDAIRLRNVINHSAAQSKDH